MQYNFTINIDGGSRGNPGQAAIGIVIRDEKGDRKEYSRHIGRATNNEAEYRAAIFALQKLKAIYGEKKAKESLVQVRTDSTLVVKQMNSSFKVESPNIKPLFAELSSLRNDFHKIDFVWIRRENNKEADRLANKELDKKDKLHH